MKGFLKQGVIQRDGTSRHQEGRVFYVERSEKIAAIAMQLSDIEGSAVCLALRAADAAADVEDALEGMLGHTRGIPAPHSSDLLAQRGYRILERHGAGVSDCEAFSYLELADFIEDARRDARKKPNE